MNNSFSWIKVYRKFSEWEWHDVPNMVSVWVHLLILANYEDKQWHGITIERGQIVIGIESFSKTVGITVRELRTCIERLCSSNMITKKTTNKYTIITICNYDKYQSCDDVFGQTNDKQTTTEKQSSGNQLTTTKEYKNIRSKEEEKRDTDVSPKKGKFDFLAGLISLDVEEQVAKDWMKVRAAKKASDSSTAFKQLETALNKILQTYGISHNDAIRVCVTNGWYGCKESYFSNIRLSDYNISPVGQASLFDANTNQKTEWE